ncbi:MAG: hypothetical protein LIO46_01785 [Clostridiales bacterium]|nr:hypothetical protein [Clostridiales bacterium]
MRGADRITFHVESESDPAATIGAMHAAGCGASMSSTPATPAAALYPYLSDLEMVLVMSVEPGFGGQSFLPDTMEKAASLHGYCRTNRLDVDIQVDGGIDAATAPAAAAAG